MAKGDSGRVVLEISPDLKKQIYSILALEQKTLKDWFIEQAEEYVRKKKNPFSSSLEINKR